ncbi:MAG: putative calcium binding protein [Streblomastix strix]|uniref:Putative calcium binding protein n=1 Tax=Streblomastix strix TaxID=222440 RepID=A0A5J4WPN5_9EUKA|nr:MAG: putative calcium binding protein [Streblomastix strix]
MSSQKRQELTDQELLELFNIVDLDHGGTIDREELIELLKKLGFEDDKEEIDAIVASVDSDGSGDIDPYEFINGFQKKLVYNPKKLKRAFQFFAKGSPKGFIRTDLLIRVLNEYQTGHKDANEKVESLVRVMVTGNQLPEMINYSEFIDTMVSEH